MQLHSSIRRRFNSVRTETDVLNVIFSSFSDLPRENIVLQKSFIDQK